MNDHYERASFEAWLQTQCALNQQLAPIEILWRAWQARAGLPSPSSSPQPVAVISTRNGYAKNFTLLNAIDQLHNGEHPLYAAPPVERPPLAEDSIFKILTVDLRHRLNVWPNFDYGGHRYFRSNGSPANVRDCDFVLFTRAVEAAQGIAPVHFASNRDGAKGATEVAIDWFARD
ncbi:MAG: hypothetical protein K2Q11_12330 [Burkholderiaceae bacterium]|nr:hypothetical protein [Burkholderiaceae bacterium]